MARPLVEHQLHVGDPRLHIAVVHLRGAPAVLAHRVHRAGDDIDGGLPVDAGKAGVLVALFEQREHVGHARDGEQVPAARIVGVPLDERGVAAEPLVAGDGGDAAVVIVPEDEVLEVVVAVELAVLFDRTGGEPAPEVDPHARARGAAEHEPTIVRGYFAA